MSREKQLREPCSGSVYRFRLHGLVAELPEMAEFTAFQSMSRDSGGERGIRTLEGLLTLTPLAGVFLRPRLSTAILEIACFIGYFYTGFHRYL